MGDRLVPPCPKIEPGQQELTPEQEAYARQFAQEHIASMLSTTAIDEQEAEMHLREAYKVAGIEPPVTIRWFDSPIAFIHASIGPSIWASIGDSIRASIWASIRDSIRASIGASIRDSIRASIRASIWASIWASIGDSIRASIGASIRDSIRASIRDSIWASIGDSIRASIGASIRDSIRASIRDSIWASIGDSIGAYYDENWLSFYRFFHEVFQENKLIHLALFNEMVSGYYLGSKEAWLVRKPVILERDDRGRLHNPSGMCMQYRDGWGFYAWHGVRVSEKIILSPSQITREDWMYEENVEVRRVIQERLGNERFVELIGGECIDTGKRGRLIAIDLGGDPESVAHYVHVKDSSTEREYYLRVPPTIEEADEAVAWTFGMDVASYCPVQEA